MNRTIYNLIWLSIATGLALGVTYLIMQRTDKTKSQKINIIPESWEDYFPAEPGMEWKYSYAMNSKGEKFRDELITKISAVIDDKIFVESGPKKLTYIKKDDGIIQADSGNYLIKEPIKENNSWGITLGGLKGRMKILKTRVVVTVKKKKYDPCIVVEKAIKDKDETVVMRAWYAKGVGLVKMDSYSQKKDGSRETLVMAELEDFHKP